MAETGHPALMKKAYRLWKAYKTETAEYRDLAKALSMASVGDLNAKCSRMDWRKRGFKP